VPRRQCTPQPSALNAVGGRVFQRKTRARARARASGTRGGSGPPGSMLVLPRGRSRWTWEVPDPYGGSEALAVSFRASLPLGHVASPDPSPSGKRVRGRWPEEVRACPMGPGCSVLWAQLRITTRVLPCRSKSGYPCYRVPTVAPGPTLGEVRTHRWGHFCDLAPYSLKLLTAGVLTGFDHPSGCLLPHHIATAY